MPGRDALLAAVHPAPGKSLYFVARGDGSHHFSDTLSEHNRAVAQFQLRRRGRASCSASKAARVPANPRSSQASLRPWRSEERRVGKESVSTSRSRWSQSNSKTKKQKTIQK